MARLPMRTLLALLVAVPLGLSASACGDDEPSAPPPPAKKKRRASSGKGKTTALDKYDQIEDDFRRKLGESDFRPDSSGDENRDPFRSYVVRQGSVGRGTGSAITLQPTDVCTAKNSRAPGFSLRDLRLIGIVLRGTRSYAQFRDGAGFGWIVRRGDCLGKEKAIVQAVGVGSVTLEVVPDAPPNQEPPPPERKDIPLYPEELSPDAETVPDAEP